MTIIIGILGGAGTGKTSVAEHLIKTFGAVRHSFAAPLKEIVRLAFDLRHEQVYGSQAEKEAIDPRYNVSARWLLQRIGTEGVRAVLGSDFWITACLHGIQDAGRQREALGGKPYIAVIDDVRFENEATAIRKRDGVTIRLHAPIGSAAETSIDASHASEANVYSIFADAEIQPKCRGLAELFKTVDEELEYLGVEP